MKNKINSILQKSINVLLFSALVFNALSARANMAAPSRGGMLSGEPNGLERVYIRRENLTIDFRPVAAEALEADKKVWVEAAYEIENTGADQPLQLVFMLGASEFSNFEFLLDDRKIASQVFDRPNLPEAWRMPPNTPWRDGRELGFYPSSTLQKTASIALVIPSGRHALKARYKVPPAFYYGQAPQMLYQFVYILAPARDWAGFGGLDLTIHLPEGWEMVTSPRLEQTGATVQAHFDQLPADALAVTFGKPLPAGYYRLKEILFWAAVLSVFGPAVLLIWLFLRQRRKGSVQPALGFLLSLPWAALVGLAGVAAAFGADYFYPTITYGYDGLFYMSAVALICLAVFIGGGLGWLICALVFKKRKRVAL